MGNLETSMADSDHIIQLTELTDDNLVEICRAAQVIACECPAYIARILRQVRVFREYTNNCIEQFPNDQETHQWLAAQALEVEEILFRTMVELMQREGLIDEKRNVSLSKLSDRARATMMKQIGMNS
jgi:hypothetical protein